MNESSEAAEVTAHRRALRARCRALRVEVGEAARESVVANVDRVVDAALHAHHENGAAPCIAFYAAIQGEVDLSASMHRAVDAGAVVALPVVVAKDQPLVFRVWTPQAVMEPGVWGILVPRDGPEVDPDLLLIPVVGFDDARFRLGNGGGFYDRTLAARVPRPRAVGIGFDCLRLPTIRPQAHDLPMDLVITEHVLSPSQLSDAFR